MIEGLKKIPDVDVYKREEMPERFHYSNITHRLGDVIVVPKKDGLIFNEVNPHWNCLSILIDCLTLTFRAREPIQTSVITDGTIYSVQCKQFLWHEVRLFFLILKLVR